jgi:hypothetical protein
MKLECGVSLSGIKVAWVSWNIATLPVLPLVTRKTTSNTANHLRLIAHISSISLLSALGDDTCKWDDRVSPSEASTDKVNSKNSALEERAPLSSWFVSLG